MLVKLTIKDVSYIIH